MAAGPFPPDWLAGQPGEAASDLELVVLLINSFDALDDPPDRLTDLRWFRAALRAAGHEDLATQLHESDIAALRTLRDRLRLVFTAAEVTTARDVLNALIKAANALPELIINADGGLALAVAPERKGLAAINARLPAALAEHVAERGIHRLGTCAADPCSCAFVDRTRAATRRFCCTYCNDRAAARAYRARRRP